MDASIVATVLSSLGSVLDSPPSLMDALWSAIPIRGAFMPSALQAAAAAGGASVPGHGRRRLVAASPPTAPGVAAPGSALPAITDTAAALLADVRMELNLATLLRVSNDFFTPVGLDPADRATPLVRAVLGGNLALAQPSIEVEAALQLQDPLVASKSVVLRVRAWAQVAVTAQSSGDNDDAALGLASADASDLTTAARAVSAEATFGMQAVLEEAWDGALGLPFLSIPTASVSGQFKVEASAANPADSTLTLVGLHMEAAPTLTIGTLPAAVLSLGLQMWAPDGTASIAGRTTDPRVLLEAQLRPGGTATLQDLAQALGPVTTTDLALDVLSWINIGTLGVEFASHDLVATPDPDPASAAMEGGLHDLQHVPRNVSKGLKACAQVTIKPDIDAEDIKAFSFFMPTAANLPAATAGQSATEALATILERYPFMLRLPIPFSLTRRRRATAAKLLPTALPDISLERDVLEIVPGKLVVRQFSVRVRGGASPPTLDVSGILTVLMQGDAAGASAETELVSVTFEGDYDPERQFWYIEGSLSAWPSPFGLSWLTLSDLLVSLEVGDDGVENFVLAGTANVQLGSVALDASARAVGRFTGDSKGFALGATLQLEGTNDVADLLRGVLASAFGTGEAAQDRLDQVLEPIRGMAVPTLTLVIASEAMTGVDFDGSGKLVEVKAGITFDAPAITMNPASVVQSALEALAPRAAARALKFGATLPMPTFVRAGLEEAVGAAAGSASRRLAGDDDECSAAAALRAAGNGTALTTGTSAGVLTLVSPVDVKLSGGHISLIAPVINIGLSWPLCITATSTLVTKLPGVSSDLRFAIAAAFDADSLDWSVAGQLEGGSVSGPFGLSFLTLSAVTVEASLSPGSGLDMAVRSSGRVVLTGSSDDAMEGSCTLKLSSNFAAGYVSIELDNSASGGDLGLLGLVQRVAPKVAANKHAKAILNSVTVHKLGLRIVSAPMVVEGDAAPSKRGFTLTATVGLNVESVVGAMVKTVLGAAMELRDDYTAGVEMPMPGDAASGSGRRLVELADLDASSVGFGISIPNFDLVPGKVLAKGIRLTAPLQLPLAATLAATLDLNLGDSFASSKESTAVRFVAGGTFGQGGAWVIQGELESKWEAPLGLSWLTVDTAKLELSIASDQGAGLSLVERTAVLVTFDSSIQFRGASRTVTVKQAAALKADFRTNAFAIEAFFSLKSSSDAAVIVEALRGGSKLPSVAYTFLNEFVLDSVGLVIATEPYASPTFGDRLFKRGATILARIGLNADGKIAEGMETFAPGVLKQGSSGRPYELAFHFDGDLLTQLASSLTSRRRLVSGAAPAAAPRQLLELPPLAFAVSLSNVRLLPGVAEIGLLSLNVSIDLTTQDLFFAVQAHDLALTLPTGKTLYFDAEASLTDRTWQLQAHMIDPWKSPLGLSWLTVTSASFRAGVDAGQFTGMTLQASTSIGPFGNKNVGEVTIVGSLVMSIGGGLDGTGIEFEDTSKPATAFMTEVSFAPQPVEKALTRMLATLAPSLAESKAVSFVTDQINLHGVWLYISNRDFRSTSLNNRVLPAGITIGARVSTTGTLQQGFDVLRPASAASSDPGDYTFVLSLPLDLPGRRRLGVRTNFAAHEYDYHDGLGEPLLHRSLLAAPVEERELQFGPDGFVTTYGPAYRASHVSMLEQQHRRLHNQHGSAVTPRRRTAIGLEVSFTFTTPSFALSNRVSFTKMNFAFSVALEGTSGSLSIAVSGGMRVVIGGGEPLIFAILGELNVADEITGRIAGGLVSGDGKWENAFGIPGFDLVQASIFAQGGNSGVSIGASAEWYIGETKAQIAGAVDPLSYINSGVHASVNDLSMRNLADWWNENYAPLLGSKTFTIDTNLADKLSYIVLDTAAVQVALNDFSIPVPEVDLATADVVWTEFAFSKGLKFEFQITIFKTLTLGMRGQLPPPSVSHMQRFVA